jgi:hypothetical protein
MVACFEQFLSHSMNFLLYFLTDKREDNTLWVKKISVTVLGKELSALSRTDLLVNIIEGLSTSDL